MDIATSLQSHPQTLKCIDMHTTGEPTRIIYSGFPLLPGITLLDQRSHALTHNDHIRRRMMLEPRGHVDMYGAIIVSDTELVRSGAAHIGVLFTTNGGFSTMCGHATIALGRFLVDTHDADVFPRRGELVLDADADKDADGARVRVNIHAPCGLVRVSVPTTADGLKSDPDRPVTFLSTPAYAIPGSIEVQIPEEVKWPELGRRESIVLDISYGGTFYALVEARELGFAGGLGKVDVDAMTSAVKKLKAYLSTHEEVVKALQNVEDERLAFLYSVMVVDRDVGSRPEGVDGAETGLCFFADNQVDRSPTGSCVSARMALAHAWGLRPVGKRWAYNSLVSNHFDTGAFTAEIVEEGVRVRHYNGEERNAVVVRVEGKAYYTGAMTFAVEEGDVTGASGFTMKGMVN
ncbi:Diaminopimelate epimerase-like protein [Aspergillus steynii IBT 23096]|uniref:trans-L-3-hydroxyproline dehydratase n=1 Tax=Aspergillus steynii IBT 23096 TaxID=1392250 RepID=A0A2I2FUX0_9EURO|nr:Diaminopimelate epimerase-like protein [Aspergillus steynii IBT 23096]PLB44397.1 Diaminopimelate epimerase-like protein [Aspergillus steynii IBT 23096]